MIYKKFKDLQLSWLGMGNMRLPVTEQRGPIDEQKAREIVEHAYKSGINYYDTAYGYLGGQSEIFVGKVLAQYPRDSWYLASKFPGHMLRKNGDVLDFGGQYSTGTFRSAAEVFERQLEKCGVDYFDFYMLHNLSESSYAFYADEDLKIIDYLLEQKKAGRIKYFGFSTHASTESIEQYLDWKKDCFDFVQIQINYMDWTLQDAKGKYENLTRRGIPVIAMEPCRGGKLASLEDAESAMLKKARPDDSIASWAFRYLQSFDNIPVVLSGMSTMEQLKENIEIYSKNDPTTEQEKQLLAAVVTSMMNSVPCTACRYCCDGCPVSLDIPKLISMYNEASFAMQGSLRLAIGALKEDELPSACIACGACNAVCPQNIDIPEVMQKFTALINSTRR